MEKISALMDGELDAQDSGRQFQRLQDDSRLAEGWDTYHLIGDCLRSETSPSVSAGFNQRLHDALSKEPTVLAPRPASRRSSNPLLKFTLPIAAAIAGVSMVAWLGLSAHLSNPGTNVATGPTPPIPGAPPANKPVAQVVLQGNVSDYLTAHQEFSPRTAMQGVASYVRTVAGDPQIQDQ